MKHFSTFSVFTICLLLAHLAAAQTSETAAIPAEQTKAVLPAIFGTSGTQTSFFAAGYTARPREAAAPSPSWWIPAASWSPSAPRGERAGCEVSARPTDCARLFEVGTRFIGT